MVEIILVAITLLALIPILFIALQVGAFTLTAFVSGCVQGGRLLMCLIFMMFTVYAISLFIFDPLLSRLLNEEIIKDSNPNVFIFSAAFLALALVLLLGKSSPFKLYGSLSVAVNTLLMTFMIYSLYSNGSQNTQSTNEKLVTLTATDSMMLYLASINLSAFLFFGYDKFRAWIFPKATVDWDGEVQLPSLNHWSQKLARWLERLAPWVKPPRVPEWILHWHSILGGTIGAAFGQLFFHHKISSVKFQPVYRKTFVIQALLIAIVIFINYSQK